MMEMPADVQRETDRGREELWGKKSRLMTWNVKYFNIRGEERMFQSPALVFSKIVGENKM